MGHCVRVDVRSSGRDVALQRRATGADGVGEQIAAVTAGTERAQAGNGGSESSVDGRVDEAHRRKCFEQNDDAMDVKLALSGHVFRTDRAGLEYGENAQSVCRRDRRGGMQRVRRPQQPLG